MNNANSIAHGSHWQIELSDELHGSVHSRSESRPLNIVIIVNLKRSRAAERRFRRDFSLPSGGCGDLTHSESPSSGTLLAWPESSYKLSASNAD